MCFSLSVHRFIAANCFSFSLSNINIENMLCLYVFNSSLCLGYSLSLKHTQNIIFLHLFITSFVCLFSLTNTPIHTHKMCLFSLSVSYSLSFCFLLPPSSLGYGFCLFLKEFFVYISSNCVFSLSFIVWETLINTYLDVPCFCQCAVVWVSLWHWRSPIVYLIWFGKQSRIKTQDLQSVSLCVDHH